MRSEAVDTNHVKIESRQSIHRRKMSKHSSIVNGADESLSYAAEDESMVRQVNLNAAFHDHLTCANSADLCKVEGTIETRGSLPCETDHLYANCSESINNTNCLINSKELTTENTFRNVLLVQLDLIKQLEDEIEIKDKHIIYQKQEINTLRSHLELSDCDPTSVLRKRYCKSEENSICNSITELHNPVTSVVNEHPNTISSVNLATRYFGRRSKTIPSRALKRRYLGPPKSISTKKLTVKSLSSATSVSSASEAHEEETVSKSEIFRETKLTRSKTSLVEVKKISKKRGKRPKGISRKSDFLTTDKAYFLPDNQITQSSLPCSETIDVPSWKLKPVTSFYQMEGTENINDPVFHRRHLKFEQDERRRKRWDIQRLREQKASQKLKHKYCREAEKESENVQQKTESFYPDPRHIQYIEVTDQLPVLAFGHLIPLFQPSEFSISWESTRKSPKESTEISPVKVKKCRLSTTGPKVT